MYCRHCGQKLPDDAQFCPACGARTAQKMETNTNGPTAAPQIAYNDYWKAVKQFGIGMKWYVFQLILYGLFIPRAVYNFADAIDNLGGGYDAYCILMALLSVATTVFYVLGFLANLKFKKTFVYYVYAEWILSILTILSMLFLMPANDTMVVAIIISLCICVGLLIANCFYFKKRVALLRD